MDRTLTLQHRARTAYELGRLKMATQIVAWVLPLAAVGLIESHAREWIWLTMLLLSVTTIGLRWHSRAGVEDVVIGLQAGVPPLLMGLAFCRIAGCPIFTLASPYGALCAGVGAASGVWIGLHGRQTPGFSAGRWAATVTVGALVAALGCTGLGLGNLAGIAMGMAVSSAVVAAFPRPT